MTTRERLLNYLKENEEVFNNMIESLDDYNGYLNNSDARYWDMELIDEYLSGMKVTDIINLIKYNHFDVNDQYYIYNWEGITSYNEKDYSEFLDNYFIDEVIENIENIGGYDGEVALLIEQIKEEEEQKENVA